MMMADCQENKTIIPINKLTEDIQGLVRVAAASREFAYCPYSQFAVGAALLTDKGAVFGGCNVESRVFSPSICAERTAVCKAVSAGQRTMKAVAVVALQEEYTAPCGVCREVLSEFGGEDMDVYLAKPDMQHVMHIKLAQLLPLSFKL